MQEKIGMRRKEEERDRRGKVLKKGEKMREK